MGVITYYYILLTVELADDAILSHIAADWPDFQELRAAASAFSAKSRLTNSVSILVNELRVAFGAALLSAGPRACPHRCICSRPRCQLGNNTARTPAAHARARPLLRRAPRPRPGIGGPTRSTSYSASSLQQSVRRQTTSSPPLQSPARDRPSNRLSNACHFSWPLSRKAWHWRPPCHSSAPCQAARIRTMTAAPTRPPRPWGRYRIASDSYTTWHAS